MSSETCDGCGQHFSSGDEVAGVFTRNYAEYTTDWSLCVECVAEIHVTLRRLGRRSVVR